MTDDLRIDDACALGTYGEPDLCDACAECPLFWECLRAELEALDAQIAQMAAVQ